MNRRRFLGVGAVLLGSGCLASSSNDARNAPTDSGNASADGSTAATAVATEQAPSSTSMVASTNTTDETEPTAHCRKTPVTKRTAIYEGTTGPQYCDDAERTAETRTQ